MSKALLGMIAGMVLGFAGYFGGFGAFLLVAALGAIGFGVGRFLEGTTNSATSSARVTADATGGDVRERAGHGNRQTCHRRPGR